MLSLPQLPTFGNARRGPSLTDVQAWHKNVVVPRFLEILEQVKALQRQTLEARREAEAAHAAADDTHRDNVQLRKQVADWEARAATLRAEPEQLQKVLVHAQTLADQLIADGEAQAGQVRDAAAAQAEQVRAAAQADAQRIRAEAETAAQALVGEARQLYEQHDAIVRTIQAVSAQAATAFRDLAGQVEQTAEALAKSRPHADAIQAIKHG